MAFITAIALCTPGRLRAKNVGGRSGGQAVSWLIGVPRASACILEVTVPYSMAACREKMAAGPPALGYCSPEVRSAGGLGFFYDVPVHMLTGP